MPNDRPFILLIHPDAQVQARVISATQDFELVVARSKEEATPLLKGRAPALVLSEAGIARRLFKDLDQYAAKTIRVVFCSAGDAGAMRALVEFAAEGHSFHTLSPSLSTLALHHYISELVHVRQAGRVGLAPGTDLLAQFTVDGHQYEAHVLDAASQGFGLGVSLNARVQGLTPRKIIERLRVRNARGSLLRAPRASIRHIKVIPDSPFGALLRIGVWIPAQEELPVRSTREQTQDVVKGGVGVLATIRRAKGRRSEFRLQADPSAAQIEIRDIQVHSIGDPSTLSLDVDEGTLAVPGDIFELQFDFRGQGYRGDVAVLQRAGDTLTVCAPRVLRLQHRRYARRIRPRKPVVVSFTSPLTGRTVVRRVVDLQGGGLSFVTDEAREPLPPALRLRDVTLRLPDGAEHHFDGSVRGCRPLTSVHGVSMHGIEQPSQCGIQLLDVSDAARDAILDVCLDASHPGVSSASDVPMRDVWQTFCAAERGFPDHPAEMSDEATAQLQRVHDGLRTADGALCKPLVFREGSRVTGYASGLRVYSRTWMLQHLLVAPTFERDNHQSHQLTTAVLDYGESLEDIEYLRCAWFERTRWTHRITHRAAKLLETPGLTELRQFHYLRLPLRRGVVTTTEQFGRTRTANHDDLVLIESHLKQSGRVAALNGEDLGAEEMTLGALGKRYACTGLERGRQIFVADNDHGVPCVVALAEYSTDGICWPELTNGVRLLTISKAPPETLEACKRALLAHSIRFYRERNRPSTIALVDNEDVALLENLGFADLGSAYEWTCHKSLGRAWQSISTALFEKVERRSTEGAIIRQLANELGGVA